MTKINYFSVSKKYLDTLFNVKLKDAKNILKLEGLPQSESFQSFDRAFQSKADEIKMKKEQENADASKAKCYEKLMELKVSILSTFNKQLVGLKV
jgi:hypothetical protein